MDEEDAEAPSLQGTPKRNPLGLGSRFGRSADGRLECLPSVRLSSPPVMLRNASIDEDGDTLEEAGGALQGVSANACRRLTSVTFPDSISDTLLISGKQDTRRSKLKSIEDEQANEADLVAGRHTPPEKQSACGEGMRESGSDDSLFTSRNVSDSLSDFAVSDSLSDFTLEAAAHRGNLSLQLDIIEPSQVPLATRPSHASSSKMRANMDAAKPEKAKKHEPSEKEKHLLAQITELERLLASEKTRKRNEAKASRAPQMRQRLIVCSQWLPYQIAPGIDGEPPSIVDCDPHLSAYDSVRRLDVTWVGCPSVPVPPEQQAVLREQLEAKNCLPVFALPSTMEEAEGISSEVLWPLFHYIPLSMMDSDTELMNARWQGYKTLNADFAQVVLSVVKSTDLVWVHDYYLMLLPAMLREKQPKMKIGWFLHTPFPSSEIYVTLPLRKEILRGVLAANLIGFQIYDYVRHFMTACSRVLGTDVNVESTYILDALKSKVVTVDAFPAGIDCAKFEQMLESAELKDKVIELQRRFDGKKLLLGVDRMDYIKGIPHKLIALESFLQGNPQWAGRIQLVQIATPPRGDTSRYQKLRNKVHKLVGRINGRFGTLEHAPIHYLDQSVTTCEMCALCFLADLALITSLREGMSQVAFEFIACQQRNRSHGVLILSEFAGAAQTLGSGAILVNPFNTDEVSHAIYEALHMPESEREDRQINMYEYVNKFTMQYWCDDFVTELLTQEQDHDLLPLASPVPLPKSEMLESFQRHSNRRLIVLGLLGTLITYHAFKSMQPLPDALWKDLLVIASDPRNTVVIVSGRERALLSQWIGDLPVWISAENGCYYRLGSRAAEWQCMIEGVDDSWISSIKPVVKYFEERTPNSVIETQEHSITWHYSDADDDFGEIQASDLQMHLEKVLGNQPVEVLVDSKMVQVRPYAVSKGAIVEAVVEACTGYSRETKSSEERKTDLTRGERESNISLAGDASSKAASEAASDEADEAEFEADQSALDFVLCIGTHSMRDEDIFTSLQKEASNELPWAEYLPDPESTWTCRVGQQPSQARYFLEDELAVAAILANLASRCQQAPPAEPLPVATSPGNPEQPADAAPLLSPLDDLEAIEAMTAGHQLAFFLDYDGTLTPIVDTPSEAVLTEEARAVVRDLAGNYPTAIVSGRARLTAQCLVQLDGVYYAGSHGFDIAGPLRSSATSGAGESDRQNEIFISSEQPPGAGRTMPSISYKVADSFRPALEEAKAKAEQSLSHINGVLVEDNTFSVSVHYRLVAEGADRDRVDKAMEELVAEMPMLRRTYGKMVYELRPSAEWDKGKAVEWLFEQFQKGSDEEVFPVYIGDDVTDEDAFRVMGELGGIGIVVSETATKDNTAACYALRNPAEVLNFLTHFANRTAPLLNQADDPNSDSGCTSDMPSPDKCPSSPDDPPLELAQGRRMYNELAVGRASTGARLLELTGNRTI
eukprot:CAMPEP_0119329412 /NCGR_PEP_ID=MMETSP1333-20130426/75747_1 /TAXON_ID=418940 /ORGANISM="Scyphosphaera apsteinii, Strain RCC1455" /LENGTH=1456 /DNA_ID=CAMNT_0007338521 /DNA_START=106 /DNA_END=4476 /DNA_ORIENTATION=-